MNHQSGLLFVLSGPSGTGKSTVIREVLRRNPSLYFSISCTTRAPRPGEAEGIHYYFVDRETFGDMIAKDEFLEYAEYAGNQYGTPLPQIEKRLRAGIDVLLDIEVQGAAHVREKRPDAIRIFLAPPSFAELERRLRGRDTDLETKIRRRLEIAREELLTMPRYDYVVVNHAVDQAASDLEAIFRAEHCRPVHHMNLIEEEQ